MAGFEIKWTSGQIFRGNASFLPPRVLAPAAAQQLGACDARSGTGSLENFPHLAHTTSELRVRELDSEAPSSRTRCSGVVCTRWGKFSREPVPDLASQLGAPQARTTCTARDVLGRPILLRKKIVFNRL